MAKKDAEYNHDDTMAEKILKTVNADGNYGEQPRVPNEEQVIDNGYENAPDEGRGDVPTEDKIIRDPETGEEKLVKNDNKNWKLK